MSIPKFEISDANWIKWPYNAWIKFVILHHQIKCNFIFLTAYQETGFLYAIQSAGVAYSLADACSRGFIRSCRCKESTTQKMLHQQQQGAPAMYTTSKCLDSTIEYGIKESRRLLRNVVATDSRWLIDEHNKEAGRLVSHASFE